MVYVRTDCIYFIDFEALNYLPMTIYSIHAFVQTLENTESIMCSVLGPKTIRAFSATDDIICLKLRTSYTTLKIYKRYL